MNPLVLYAGHETGGRLSDGGREGRRPQTDTALPPRRVGRGQQQGGSWVLGATLEECTLKASRHAVIFHFLPLWKPVRHQRFHNRENNSVSYFSQRSINMEATFRLDRSRCNTRLNRDAPVRVHFMFVALKSDKSSIIFSVALSLSPTSSTLHQPQAQLII